MKKILLNKSEKKAIVLERENVIINNFAKTFNSIKRISEGEVDLNSRLSENTEEINYEKDRMQNTEEPVFDSARHARDSAEHDGWQCAGRIFQDLDDETRFSREALINIADGMKAGIDNYLIALLNSYPDGQLK